MTQIPRPEHPQPQMKREHWKNLNGEWDFSFDFGCSGIDQKWQEGKTDWEKKILVPFCPESDLSGIGYKDFIPGVWYHRTITLTGEELKGDLLLHFGAVDYDARVWINEVEAGRHLRKYILMFQSTTGSRRKVLFQWILSRMTRIMILKSLL